MENKIIDDTLNPSLEEPVGGGDLGSENVGGGGANVVVKTKTIVECTQISVVETVGESKDDVLRREIEGVFGDFDYTDEGMDMDRFLASGNGNAVEPGLGGEVDGNENEGRNMMDIGLAGEKEKNGENGAEVAEVKEGTEKNDEGEVKNGLEVFEWNEDVKKDGGNGEKREENGRKVAEREEENDREEDEMEEDHDYVVGDFVWGKIKSHPWWPGQIYDPSNASDHAVTLKRKRRLLVAYFGDGSFSWCSPSQLKPFVDNFQAMVDQSDSKKFLNAVHKALEQVSKLVQAELMSKRQTDDRVENVCVGNSGIKEGVLVPKGNTIKVLVNRMASVELLSTLKAYATMEPGIRLLKLELTVLKSCLSVFYSQKGGYLLPEYQNPKYIEGLEDEKRSGIVADSDINGPSEGDNAYQKRKKSVAQLMGEAEPKGTKAKSSTGIKRERKRKLLVVSVEPESDDESGGGGAEDDMVSPRRRKKSKYLSPPYYSPKVNWNSGSGLFKEAKTEGEKTPEMAATQLEDSSKKSSGKRSRQKKSQPEHKKTIDADVDVDMDKVLYGLLSAALDPSDFVKKNLPAITDFISSFRGSIFEEGSKSNAETHVKNDGIVTDVKKDGTATDVKKDGIVTTLIIEFPPEATLPTKWELSKTYKNFGDYIKKESHINGSSAFVVFGNSSDAVAALAMSLEKKLLGGVKYHLSEEVVSRAKRGSKKAPGEDTSDLAFIEQKLETMSEMVECAESVMSSEVKVNLEGGFAEVLEKVGKMRAK